ncbi:Zn(II)2Cys6 transcription factor domain-containing protein [Aspergillus clavatus NRRL 1]|uniref:C6 finger domain protein, putative n=1 Tax=Aspergillus clavatus (strain ATCC 1007 / CBS 513.65 / DSM 816 / NCTC 3887 / NRRL 1 / QM 1276 / 107) TaxID=344612 RepID=A1CTQ5_ASPCL|nr:C6 finger domain protein, putative [Aspergillus clavatus NRRL 1]EAW06692.1 C6 finger domain protein, putative [Aspergillus clavatus NRRL 1]
MSHQGPPRPFRPIAPRTLLDPPTPGPVAEETKIRRASTACTECKKRRTKCSADSTGIPCSECALHGRTCIIDELADKRRKVAAKRTQEELEYYRVFVEHLLEVIRHGEQATIDAVINTIRSGASLNEIRAEVAKSLRYPDEVDGIGELIDGLGDSVDGLGDLDWTPRKPASGPGKSTPDVWGMGLDQMKISHGA